MTDQEIKIENPYLTKTIPPWYQCEGLLEATISLDDLASGASITLKSPKGRDIRRVDEYRDKLRKSDAKSMAALSEYERDFLGGNLLPPEYWCESFRAYLKELDAPEELCEEPMPERKATDQKAWLKFWDGLDSNLIHRLQEGIAFFSNDRKSDPVDDKSTPNV